MLKKAFPFLSCHVKSLAKQILAFLLLEISDILITQVGNGGEELQQLGSQPLGVLFLICHRM